MTGFPQRLDSPTAARRRLRELLAEGSLEMPGPYDAPSAQVMARIGFKALWGGGYVGSATHLGVGDINLMTMREQAEHCQALVDASGLPVVADADDGYGGGLQISRTVQMFERAGVAGLVIEDQGSPKHCAFYENFPLKLVSREELVAKIKTAVAARKDDELMIFARTDALPAKQGIDEAVARATACVDAGAEAVLTPSASHQELAEIGRRWERSAPLVMSSFNFPQMQLDELSKIGYSARLHPLPAILAALKAVETIYTELYNKGSFGDSTKSSMKSSDYEELLGGPIAENIDKDYRDLAGI